MADLVPKSDQEIGLPNPKHIVVMAKTKGTVTEIERMFNCTFMYLNFRNWSPCGCLSCLSLCGPVMEWRPVQGVPRLSSDDRLDRLRQLD